MKAIVSEKGQVTIPKALRDQLGLRPGQELEFNIEEGKLMARKLRSSKSLEEVAGILKDKLKNVDDYLTEVRGPNLKQ